MKYSEVLTTTPQSRPIPGSTQTKNSAGGYTWEMDKWGQLDRFLILGTEGGTFYIEERDLTLENAKALLACIKEDGIRTVNRIIEISKAGRAHTNDPALFALAVASSPQFADEATRKLALGAIKEVARTFTHLTQYLNEVTELRGWGRGLRNGVSGWYTSKAPDYLAYQLVKYRNRNGWEHCDVLNVAHPSPVGEKQTDLFDYIINGFNPEKEYPKSVEGFEKAKTTTTSNQVVQLIKDYNLPREAIPTEFLNSTDVWEALLEDMPIWATIRNLGKMSNIGLLTPMSEAEDKVISRITDGEILQKARVHPLNVLTALLTYRNGEGVRGSLYWGVSPRLVDALQDSFYRSFDYVEPINKRFVLGVDVSGSMDAANYMGFGRGGSAYLKSIPGLTPRTAATALALVTAKTESRYYINGFSDRFEPLGITAKTSLDGAIEKTNRMRMGGTDCALPMIWALRNNIPADVFIVYTDSETWYGGIHPAQALKKYREEMGIPAKLLVVAMVANRRTIADPNDAGMLDVVGFDSSLPVIIENFVKEG